MALNRAISICLAITALFSIAMLQMGGDAEHPLLLPVLAVPILGTAVWWVDFKEKFSLSEGWANVLILLVTILNLGKLIQAPSMFLAYSIANILIWVQLILFYRKKDILVLYHILTLSFVNGGVASVFHNTSIFAPLLLAFLFSVIVAISLIFLQQENRYYQNNAFLKPAFGGGEKIERVTVGHLAVLAARTIVGFPLMLVLGYRWKQWIERGHHSKDKRKSVEAAAVQISPKQTTRIPLVDQAPSFSTAAVPSSSPPVSVRYVVGLLFGALGSLMLGVLIFLTLPRFPEIEIGQIRFGHDQWRGTPATVRSVVGFNEQVRLGEIGPSADNFEKVMTIRFSDQEDDRRQVLPENAFFYLRGTALVRYEDRSWFAPTPTSENSPGTRFIPHRGRWPVRVQRGQSKTEGFQEAMKGPGYLFSGKKETLGYALFDRRNGVVREEINMFPLSTPILFTVWPYFQIGRTFGRFEDGRLISISRDPNRQIRATYYTNAFSSEGQIDLIPYQNETDRLLEQAISYDAEKFPALSELAVRWDRQSGLSPEQVVQRAKNLENHLRSSGEYRYVRSGVQRKAEIDPLEDFATEHRQGHCEYFAGALALMLRAIGIPSRVIVGFMSQYSPDAEGFSTVRQSDAHTWVEAYIPPSAIPEGTYDPTLEQERQWWSQGGWLRLDAVPVEESMKTSRSLAISWGTFRDSFKNFWNDCVLNYNFERQSRLVYQPAGELYGFLRLKVVQFTKNWHWPTFLKSDEAKKNAERSIRAKPSRGWGVPISFTGMAAFVFFMSLAMLGILWYRRRGRYDMASREASVLLAQLESTLARWGTKRKKAQTPWEFLDQFLSSDRGTDFCRFCTETFSLSDPAEKLSAVVRLYYHVRFGGNPLDETRRAEVADFFRQINRRRH